MEKLNFEKQISNLGARRILKVLKHGEIVYFAVCRNSEYQIFAGKITKVKKETVRMAVSGGRIIERSKENVYENFDEVKNLISKAKKEREQW